MSSPRNYDEDGRRFSMNERLEPYVGPRPFETKDASIFFGRDREARELHARIIADQAVLLYAQSGAGKTSLINAKLVLSLANSGFEVYPVARVGGPVPEGFDNREIDNVYMLAAISGWTQADEEPIRLPSATLTQYLASRPHLFHGDEPAPRVLIFDQLEELFTKHPAHWSKRQDFFRQLGEALGTNPLLRILLSIREDYLAQLDPFVHLVPDSLRSRMRLERLRRDAALQALKGPLSETRYAFGEGVAEALVEKLLTTVIATPAGQSSLVKGEFVEPLELQVVGLALLRELPLGATQITFDHLESLVVERALASYYVEAIKEAARQSGVPLPVLARACEATLITASGTRSFVDRNIDHIGLIPAAAADILESRRVIRAEWRSGARWYELSHDNFIGAMQTAHRALGSEWVKELEYAQSLIRGAFELITRDESDRTPKNGKRALENARKAKEIAQRFDDASMLADVILIEATVAELHDDKQGAIHLYEQLLDLEARTGNVNALSTPLYLGDLNSEIADFAKATDWFTKYIEMMPNQHEGYKRRGETYWYSGKLKLACEDLTIALARI